MQRRFTCSSCSSSSSSSSSDRWFCCCQHCCYSGPCTLLSITQAARSLVTTAHTHIPKSKHDPYRTPPKNYVQLLQHITRARQLGGLEQLVQQYGPKFDGVHVAAAMSMLPKLHQPARPGSRLTGQKLKQRRQIPARLLGKLQVR
jgi:hypothetical protein